MIHLEQNIPLKVDLIFRTANGFWNQDFVRWMIEMRKNFGFKDQIE